MSAASAAGGSIVQIWLIRHGQTIWNVTGRLQGAEIDLPLDSHGHSQVAQTAAFLKPYGPFDSYYSSPLTRAQQTMRAIRGFGSEPVASAAATAASPPTLLDANLIEHRMGEISGKYKADRERHLVAHRKLLAEHKLATANATAAGTAPPPPIDADPYATVPGAETYRALRLRIDNFFERLISDQRKAAAAATSSADSKSGVPIRNVVIVSHGQWIQTAIHHLFDRSDGSSMKPVLKGAMLGPNEENCHISVFQYHFPPPAATAAATASGGWSLVFPPSNVHLTPRSKL